MSTIPAKQIVNVSPSVLAASGSALDLNGLVLTTSTRVPIGAVLSFSSPASVNSFFGPTSTEAGIAAVYFAGFDNSNVKPGAILFAQYNTGNVAAYVRGGNVSGLSLTQLQAISGSLAVTIDGVLKSASINLSAATSFSNAAEIIAGALGIEGVQGASFIGSITGTVLTVASGLTGTLAVGDTIDGSGVTTGTYIASFGTGTGGLGTYNLSNSMSVSNEAMTAMTPAVQYDSVLGAFSIFSGTAGGASTIGYASGAAAVSLALTQATGAMLSQGSAAAAPSAFMSALVRVTQNWASFMLAFAADAPDTNTNRLAFAAWTSLQNNRYMFVCWDTSIAPTLAVPATSSLGYAIAQANYSGTFLVWENADYNDAGFVMGIAASIDFSQSNGRTTFKFRQQAGHIASVTDEQVAVNLGGSPSVGDRGNGYNFYGAYAPANDEFLFLANGIISGPFLWADSYVNQIWLNNALQLALIVFLVNAKSVPYNVDGNTLIEAALNDVIQQGLTFGAYRAGVQLSASQIAQVNAQAGKDIATTLAQRGWYLLIGQASPEVRQARGTPPMAFFYVDGESVQYINLASVALQ